MTPDPLHVGVNLLWLVPGVVGGSEEYTAGLLLGLADRAPDDLRVTLFALDRFARAYPDIAAAFPTVTLRMSGRSKPLRVTAESTWLAWQLRRHCVDLVHHAGGTMPILARRRAVVTVHDLQPFVLPGFFSSVKRGYLRWRIPPSVRRARRVLTLTEYTRATIVQQLHLDPGKIDLVPPGLLPSATTEPTIDPSARYQLDGPFFLYPAITYPHKNHLMLARAFAGVVEARPDALLVLTGGAAQCESELAAELIDLGIAHRVRRLGRIPREDLDWLYREAMALAFPSRFEGFGMPVLEAMARGCPVLAADATALPEVVGSAGMLVPPDDVAGWTAAMLELLCDDGRRMDLRVAGMERAARFSWASAVASLEAAYGRAVEPPP